MRFVIVALLSAVVASAADAPVSMTGWVSDGHCTTRHMKPGGAACVRKCIAGAEHLNPDWKPGGMVFVTEDKKEVWKVDNPDALWDYAGERVVVSAVPSTDKRSLRIVEARPPQPQQ